mgnify:CR=1 FL=1
MYSARSAYDEACGTLVKIDVELVETTVLVPGLGLPVSGAD